VGLGLSASGNRIWCILALNLTSGGKKFTNFPENQSTTVYALSTESKISGSITDNDSGQTENTIGVHFTSAKVDIM